MKGFRKSGDIHIGPLLYVNKKSILYAIAINRLNVVRDALHGEIFKSFLHFEKLSIEGILHQDLGLFVSVYFGKCFQNFGIEVIAFLHQVDKTTGVVRDSAFHLRPPSSMSLL